VAVVAVAALIAALASTSIAGAGSSAQARGITDDEITVAGLGPENPYNTFGASVGAKARFEAENAKGGVNGRTINYTGWTDDGNTQDSNLAATQKLIQQDQVFAIVPVLTPWFINGATFAAQQKTPAFGWGIAPGFCTSKFAFGFTGCLVPPPPVKVASNTWGGLINDLFESSGEGSAKGKTAAVVSEDNDSGKSGQTVIGATAEAVGMKIVYGKASMPAPPAKVGDYSPYVNEILTSNAGGPPDVIFLVISQENTIGMQTALGQVIVSRGTRSTSSTIRWPAPWHWAGRRGSRSRNCAWRWRKKTVCWSSAPTPPEWPPA
jgi:hypothetical protein